MFLAEVKALDVSKATSDNFFVEVICYYFNKSFEKGKFPICLKLANTTPAFKKGARTAKKIIIGQLVFSLFFKRCLKGYLVNNF